jgi:hypothetical protein
MGKAIYHNGPAGFVAGAGGVSDARLAKLASGKVLHCTQAVADDAIGATLSAKAAGETVSIDWINKQGTLRVTASGAIAREADAYQDDDGKVCALPASSVPAWEASTSYAEGDLVRPTTANEHYYKCTSAGTSNSSEPTWPTDGTTVDDNTATWQDMGSSKFKKVGKALQAASGDGSVFGVIPHGYGDTVDIAD